MGLFKGKARRGLKNIGRFARNLGLGIADTGLSALGANNVIKEKAYRGKGKFADKLSKKLGGLVRGGALALATGGIGAGVAGKALGKGAVGKLGKGGLKNLLNRFKKTADSDKGFMSKIMGKIKPKFEEMTKNGFGGTTGLQPMPTGMEGELPPEDPNGDPLMAPIGGTDSMMVDLGSAADSLGIGETQSWKELLRDTGKEILNDAGEKVFNAVYDNLDPDVQRKIDSQAQKWSFQYIKTWLTEKPIRLVGAAAGVGLVGFGLFKAIVKR